MDDMLARGAIVISSRSIAMHRISLAHELRYVYSALQHAISSEDRAGRSADRWTCSDSHASDRCCMPSVPKIARREELEVVRALSREARFGHGQIPARTVRMGRVRTELF